MPTPEQLRRSIANLVRLAERDLAILFRQVSDTRSRELRAALMDVLPELVQTYGAAAASIAADWYDELRAEAGATGRFTAIPAEIRDAGAKSLVGYAAATAKDDTAFKTLIVGGIQRRIANGSRETVTRSSIADPRSVGWKRIGAGACSFCRMLIERDQLYTEETADFGSHDHCNCQAYPLIKGAEPIDVKKYVQTKRDISDADRSRVREWIATHPSG